MTANVATRSARQDELERRRRLPRDLRAGTRAMLQRSHGRAPSKGLDPLDDYLPRYPAEAEDEYSLRRARTVLYNGYGYTVGYIAGKILSRPIEAFSQEEWITALVANVDGEGQDLTRFAWQLVPEALDSGVTYVLVDWTGDTRGKTRRAARGVGPRFIHVPPSAVVKWRTRTVDGRPEIARLQVEEVGEESVDHWTEQSIRRVRVYYAAGEPRSDGTEAGVLSWELWKIPDRGDPLLEEGPVDAPPLTFIPVVPYYTRRCAFFEGEPALEDQAWLQLSHWKKRSNLDNVLDVCTVPTLERVGVSDTDLAAGEMGVYRYFHSSNPQAQTRWVELQGGGVKLLVDDVTNLEARIMLLGMQPMVAKPTGGLVTATERLLDEENALSQLEAWALSLQDSLELAFEYAANWQGKSLAENVVQVHADLTFDMHGAAGVEFLRWMRDRGDLSAASLYDLARMRGLLPDRFDGKAEVSAVGGERGGDGQLVQRGLQRIFSDDPSEPPPEAAGEPLGA